MLKVRARVETLIKTFFSAMIFISVLLGLIDFSHMVMLRSGPNSCCQQNIKCFDMPLLSLGSFSFFPVTKRFVFMKEYQEKVCFHERIAMTVEKN